MHVNPDYVVTDEELVYAAVEARPLGTLVVVRDDVPWLAHLPFVVQRRPGERTRLTSHVPRVDPLAGHLFTGARALAVFVGPVSYVSPAWYDTPGLPTYNYVAVHLDGEVTLVEDTRDVRAHLMTLVAEHERRRPEPWRPDATARAATDELLPEILTFHLDVDTVQAKFKLGQNRTPADRDGTMAGLRQAAASDAADTARLMGSFPYDGTPHDR